MPDNRFRRDGAQPGLEGPGAALLEPLVRLPLNLVRELHAYRGFISASVRREFRARYAASQFGLLWAVIQPFALISLYTLVFANLLHSRLPGHEAPLAYSIYLCAGLLSWTFFSELLTRGVGIFVSHASLLKNIAFPRRTLPVIAILSSLLQFVIIMAIFLGMLLVTGYFPGWIVLAAIPVVLVLIAFTIALGLLAGIVNVFFRDVEQGISMLLQFWFWFTPIVYPVPILPQGLATLLPLNPLYPIVTAMQAIFLEARAPDWLALLYPLVLALGLLALGRRAYRYLGADIVDQL